MSVRFVPAGDEEVVPARADSTAVLLDLCDHLHHLSVLLLDLLRLQRLGLQPVTTDNAFSYRNNIFSTDYKLCSGKRDVSTRWVKT